MLIQNFIDRILNIYILMYLIPALLVLLRIEKVWLIFGRHADDWIPYNFEFFKG